VDGGDEFLTHLKARNVQVSLGHCNASYERAAAAVAAGAAAVTHMFNCCSSLSNRNPGYTGLLPPPHTCAIGPLNNTSNQTLNP
jgi:N-acetylglucosamine-6-phosphate deacetylase